MVIAHSATWLRSEGSLKSVISILCGDTSQISCINTSSPAEWNITFTSPSIFLPGLSSPHRQDTDIIAILEAFRLFIKTVCQRHLRHTFCSVASCDSFDTLPGLKRPSGDRLQGSHVCQEQRAEWVMVPGNLNCGKCAHTHLHSRCKTKPNDWKVNQMKGVNRHCACDG